MKKNVSDIIIVKHFCSGPANVPYIYPSFTVKIGTGANMLLYKKGLVDFVRRTRTWLICTTDSHNTWTIHTQDHPITSLHRCLAVRWHSTPEIQFKHTHTIMRYNRVDQRQNRLQYRKQLLTRSSPPLSR